MSAGHKETGEIFLLIEEGKDADADSAGDAEQHRLGEWLTGVRRAHTGVRQEDAQRCRGRDASGEMPARGRVLF
jgi:hypothetical protein